MQDISKVEYVKKGYGTLRLVSENPPAAQYLRGRLIAEATADQAGVRCWSPECEVWLREYFSLDKIQIMDLVVPLVDVDGELAAVRAWPLPIYERDLTRRAMMGEGWSKGLVMAAGLGVPWLRGEIDPVEFWIVEGEPDLLTAYQVWAGDEQRKDVAIIGIVSGSWTKAHADKIKPGSRVLILTHDDELAEGQKYPQGEQYARHVFFSLPEGCEALRFADPAGEHRDLNDLLKVGELEGRELADFCAPYQPEPDPVAPPAPPKETGSERGSDGVEDEGGWIIARAALAWVTTWEKCLSWATGPGGTHGKGGWAGLAYTCFRAAAGLQERRHRVSVAQMEGVEGADGAFARLDPKAMADELDAAVEVGGQKDEATISNRKQKAASCAEDGAAKPLDLDGLTKYMDTRPPELKPKKEKEKKEPKAKTAKEPKPTKTPPPALRIVRLDEVAPPALRIVRLDEVAPPAPPEARDYGEDEDEAEEDRRNFPPLPQVPNDKWKDDLALNRDMEIKGSLRNIDLVLTHDRRCKGTLKLNEFLGRLEIYGSPEWATQTESGSGGYAIPDGSPLIDDHVTGFCIWIGREYGADLDKAKALDAMRVSGRRNKYDPLANYLNGLVWDKKPRLDTWLRDYCAVKMELDIAAFTGRKWMISAVARALDPGCQADYSIVLEGNWGRSNQGSGKSQALYALCPNPEWHLVFDFDPGTKEGLEAMRGKWLIELAELAILSRGRDARVIKGFLTKMTDRYRASYGMLSEDHRRRSVFFGTVNPEGAGDYLTDPTGNRRWWPARCGGRVDVAAIRRDRDQLWAEAVWRFKQGEIYYPTDEESELLEDARELRTAKDPWTYKLVTWLSETTLDEIPISTVLDTALHLEVARQTKADQMRASIVLRAAGWTARLKGKWRVSVWCRPEGEAAPPEAPPQPNQLNLGAPPKPPSTPAPPARKPHEDDEDPWVF